MEEKKEYYLIIKGKKIMVNEEIYRMYVRPVRAEQRQRRRKWKCTIYIHENGKTKMKRCPYDCEQCEYAKSGKSATGNGLSLERLRESGIAIEDKLQNPEENLIEKEQAWEERKKLHKALSKLKPRYQLIIKRIYFENKTQEEVAEELGISQPAVSMVLERIFEAIKKNF